MIIDVILLVILLAVTWCVASEGAWGAALNVLCVILGGLLAMNFFEPLANFLHNSFGMRNFSDVIALVGLFIFFVLGLRMLTNRISPTYIQVNDLVYHIGRWGCGLLAGWVTIAFLLTALHTAPLPREFWGFKPERHNFFNFAAPDRQWLGFTQYVSERSFAHGTPEIFDGPTIQFADYPNRYWPSFPIRYASRRAGLSTMQRSSGDGGGTIKRNTPTRRPTDQPPAF
jgi:hypothetical protein